jgi:hypothetical protein
MACGQANMVLRASGRRLPDDDHEKIVAVRLRCRLCELAERLGVPEEGVVLPFRKQRVSATDDDVLYERVAL